MLLNIPAIIHGSRGKKSQVPQGNIYNSDGTQSGNNFPGGSVQWIHDNQCVDGDTITIPAGTFTWSGTLNITKRIKLSGLTTTDPVAGTANSVSIIIDNQANRNAPLVQLGGAGGQRLTGLTFQPGLTSQLNGGITVRGTTPTRIDSIFFNGTYWTPQIYWYDYNWGVIDHTVSINTHGAIVYGHMGRFGNGGDMGDSVFAQPANFGGSNFLFIEDNYIEHGPDLSIGGRLCVRYNHLYDNGDINLAECVSHGTARGFSNQRGGRAYEIYNNDFHWNYNGKNVDGPNSGSHIWHDNTWTNHNQLTKGMGFTDYRIFFSYGAPFYGADGSNPWDYNATESNGTHVDGNPPYLFESGTLSSASGPVLTDNTKNWTPTNKWVGYNVKRVSDGACGDVTASTATTITIAQPYNQNWAGGQQYEIHKLLAALDQCGRGAGDLLQNVRHYLSGAQSFPRPVVTLDSTAGIPSSGIMEINGHNDQGVRYTGVSGNTLTGCTGGSGTFNNGQDVNFRVNSVTGKSDWPHPAAEPMYSWNNIDIDPSGPSAGAHLNFEAIDSGFETIHEGVDYFNDTPLPGYTPYTYPHPLTLL